MLDIGYYNTGVSIVYGDTLLAHSTIELGGSTISNRLMNRFGLGEKLAESLKRRHIFGIEVLPGEKFTQKMKMGAWLNSMLLRSKVRWTK